jgi:hypothetical protein
MNRLHTTGRAALAAATVALAAACSADPAPSTAPVAPSASRAALPVQTLRDLAALRRATAPLHRLEAGIAAGWATPVTGCMSDPALGGMGVHYAEVPFDGSVTVERPEILVYAPGPSGKLELVAVEYAIPFDAWHGAEPPTLFGQEFHENFSFGLWVLHVWAWRDNPTGTFADYNPKVTCR